SGAGASTGWSLVGGLGARAGGTPSRCDPHDGGSPPLGAGTGGGSGTGDRRRDAYAEAGAAPVLRTADGTGGHGGGLPLPEWRRRNLPPAPLGRGAARAGIPPGTAADRRWGTRC